MDNEQYVVQSNSSNFKGLPLNYYADERKDAETVYRAESEKGRAVELLGGFPGHYSSLKQNWFVCNNRNVINFPESDIVSFLRENLPSGSGFNNPWDIEFAGHEFYCESVFEHMNDNGMYDRNIAFMVEIPFDNAMDFRIVIGNQSDRKFAEADDLVSYFEDTIAECLRPVAEKFEKLIDSYPQTEYVDIYNSKDTLRNDKSGLHTAQSNDLDFSQRFLVGSGTSSCATGDSLTDIDIYLSEQSAEQRHFCKIYDHQTNLMISGSEYLMSKYDNVDRWRPWDFTNYFKKDEECVILEQRDIISRADQEKGIKHCLVLGNWKKNDAMPDGEYATWLVTNDTDDKSFVKRGGNYFPTVFYDSPKAALAAARRDLQERYKKEVDRIQHENDDFQKIHDQGFAQ